MACVQAFSSLYRHALSEGFEVRIWTAVTFIHSATKCERTGARTVYGVTNMTQALQRPLCLKQELLCSAMLYGTACSICSVICNTTEVAKTPPASYRAPVSLPTPSTVGWRKKEFGFLVAHPEVLICSRAVMKPFCPCCWI